MGNIFSCSIFMLLGLNYVAAHIFIAYQLKLVFARKAGTCDEMQGRMNT